MKFLRLRLLLIAAIGFAFSGTANAQNTQNIDVTAFVPNVCIVDVATSETTMTFDLSGVAAATLPFDDADVRYKRRYIDVLCSDYVAFPPLLGSCGRIGHCKLVTKQTF